MNRDDSRWELIAFFGAIAMFFAAIEFLFPKPIPFMRLGIANIPIILALGIFNIKEILIITIIKVAGQGIINGTLASYVFVFSALGSFTSAVSMYSLKRILKTRISYLGISMAGALISNLVQTMFSLIFIFGKNAWIIIPYFLGIGFISSIIIGMFAERINNKSAWFIKIRKRYGALNGS